MYHFIIFLISLILVYLLTFIARRIAIAINFIDNPDERKFHTTPTPLLGGVAILFGLIFVLFISIFICKDLIPPIYELIFFYIGLILICFLGLFDDYQEMNPYIKFSIQIFIALLFIFGTKMSTILGPFYISIPVLLIWIVGLMNALNFLDNMDGITAGMATILGFGYFALGILSHNHFLSFISAIFIGSTLGFLFHNFHPAKIFLGDAGSMLIGYTLSALGIILLKEIPRNFSLLLPILLLSYAIFDISLVSLTRQRDGRGILEGGKDHSTHRIGTATGSVKVTAVMVYLINILIVIITVIAFVTENQFLILVTTIIFALVFIFFGGKLDAIPILISKNQLRKKTKKSL
ncbi:MAG: undecaprenyl/decaprenyl-phosphate alpha-N-acetylglucosaminyl 1-phosphate transferase [Candidatus Cloacimonetes bacterium]|nr:undecaprenyl/decaprenyl-phosphate alpha-N-acetylglucosaminyl 1-phosphate transferase [Candidatus Cloacimonadota bacterium]MBL7085967.1 undecaprenyl/decaprenyl-phosphate alpha-N-acetylglucosaminyl 1-phosphate transferase [Candidatus Cloacimonadota bacterium]